MWCVCAAIESYHLHSITLLLLTSPILLTSFYSDFFLYNCIFKFESYLWCFLISDSWVMMAFHEFLCLITILLWLCKALCVTSRCAMQVCTCKQEITVTPKHTCQSITMQFTLHNTWRPHPQDTHYVLKHCTQNQTNTEACTTKLD